MILLSGFGLQKPDRKIRVAVLEGDRSGRDRDSRCRYQGWMVYTKSRSVSVVIPA